MRFPIAFIAAVLLASSAGAATINSTAGPGTGTAFDLDAASFSRFGGPCGSGASVINDGCSVTRKTAASPVPYGRFAPVGTGWIDSQDISRLDWRIERPEAFTSLSFAITDAFDQPVNPVLGASYFQMRVKDDPASAWRIAERQSNRNLHWVEILFDAPTTSADVQFFTRTNDGFGVTDARVEVAPIPLPAAAWMLLAGLGAIGGLKRLGRRA